MTKEIVFLVLPMAVLSEKEVVQQKAVDMKEFYRLNLIIKSAKTNLGVGMI